MTHKTIQLIEPYGGSLINLIVDSDHAAILMPYATTLEAIILSDRSTYDLELLATGAYSPLNGFMSKTDYESVLEGMRTSDGTLFPVPITLPVDQKYDAGQDIVLKDSYGNILAVMTIEECYEWSSAEYRTKVLGSNDEGHALAKEMDTWGAYNISGRLQVISLPDQKDFRSLRLTPTQCRKELAAIGNKNVVAFQTRNPLHRAHEELTKRAAAKINGTLLLHPSVGITKPGDIDYVTRVRCYQALIDNYYTDTDVLLGLLPLAMLMAGPREALWHAIIRRNYGANHFIVGRDHAGPGADSKGKSFYEPYAAQALTKQYEEEIGVTILAYNEMVYLSDGDRYVEVQQVPVGERAITISGTSVREDYLAKGRMLPPWFTRPEVGGILADTYPSQVHQGFCLWFTGLSGSGKSTVAQAVEARLQEHGKRTTMLDGDIVRENLSKGLGFSKEDREVNIARVGFVASEVVRHRGVAICALISPYEKARNKVRNLFDKCNFIEIYISTPIDVCETRDPKGHYIKSRTGSMSGLTGLDDTYEAPTHPDITIDTSKVAIEESVERVISELTRRGFIS